MSPSLSSARFNIRQQLQASSGWIGITNACCDLAGQNSELQPDFILFLDASLQCCAAFGAEMNWQSCLWASEERAHTRHIHPALCFVI